MSHHGVSVWKYIMGWWISKAIDFEIAWVCDSIRTEVAALNLRTIIVDFRKLKIWSWKVWDWGNCSCSRFTDERTCLDRSCGSVAIWSHYLRFASCHSNSGDLSALLIIIIKFHFHYLFRKDHGKFLLVTLFLFYEVLVAFEPALIIYTCYRHESLVYALAGRNWFLFFDIILLCGTRIIDDYYEIEWIFLIAIRCYRFELDCSCWCTRNAEFVHYWCFTPTRMKIMIQREYLIICLDYYVTKFTPLAYNLIAGTIVLKLLTIGQGEALGARLAHV